MPFSLSPSVNVNEIDLTTSIPAVATSIGAAVGEFVWGPVLEATLVSREDGLVTKFGRPGETNFKDFFTVANFLAYSNNCQVVRVVGAGALNASNGTGFLIKNLADFEANITAIDATGDSVFAKYPGVEGNDIVVSVVDALGYAAQTLSYSTLTGTFTVGETITGGTSGATGTLSSFTGTDIVLTGVTGTFSSGETITGDGVGAPSATATSASSDAWAYTGEFDYAPTGTEIFAVVLKAGNIVEKLAADTSSTAKDFQGNSSYIEDIAARTSKYIWVSGTNIATDLTAAVGTPLTLTLTAGADGAAPGDAEYQAGFNLFANPDDIDVNLIMQGAASTLTGKYMIQNICDVRKDCVGFVSPNETDVVGALAPEASLKALRDVGGDLNLSSSYGVMDGNYKYQYDRYNDKYRWVPLNGDIAGLCAYTDSVADAWWSPGGFNRGQIKNVVKLAFNPNKAQRDELYKNSINPVATFRGEGTVLYGDKTMQTKPSAFDRINVRRLFIVLEKAISTAAKYTLFEFNDAFTRARFVQMVEPFLRDVQGRRGIYDFKVVCDTSNNTGEVVDRNEFVGDIYIKPARSINYIYLNFVAVKTAVNFEEVIG